MKKIVSALIAVMTLIPLAANAQSSYYDNYFKELGEMEYFTNCAYHPFMSEYSASVRKEWDLAYSQSCETPSYTFDSSTKSFNMVFADMEDLKVTSSNEDVITFEIKDYDPSAEEKYFEEYPKLYESYTLEQINSGYKKYTEKPTWWEYSGFTTEPKTWWEAYGLKSEPTSLKEVIIVPHSFGKTTATFSLGDKKLGTEEMVIRQYLFDKDSKQRLAEYINSLDDKNYTDLLFDINDYTTEEKYQLEYEISDDEDISDIIKAMKGKDISVNFKGYTNDGYDINYVINGKDITGEIKEGLNYYADISLEESEYKKEIDGLLGDKNLIYIDFAYHGELPSKYETSIPVRNYVNNLLGYDCINDYEKCSTEDYEKKVKDFYESETFTLLYYNPETKQMEKILDNLKVTENGYVNISLDHFSSYVLIRTSDYEPAAIDELTNPATKDNILTIVATLIISMVALGLFIRKYQKNN